MTDAASESTAPRRRKIRIMLFLIVPLALITATATGVSIGVRRAAVEPEKWHVDPTTAAPTGNPNWYRLTPDSAPSDRDAQRDGSAPVFAVDAAKLAAAFDAVATGDDRVEVIAGSAADGFVTYMQRSFFFGFPDFVTVKFIDVDGGSSLSIFSRAQFGKSDLNVNQKRVERWVAATTQRLG